MSLSQPIAKGILAHSWSVRMGVALCLTRNKSLCACFWLAVAMRVIAPVALAAPAGAEELSQRLERAEQSVVLLNFKQARVAFDVVRREAAEGSALWQRASYGAVLARLQSPAVGRADVAGAIGLLEGLIEESGPDSAIRAFAYKTLGRVHHMRDYPGDLVDRPAAREAYTRVIEDFPEHPLADTCRFYRIQTYLEVVGDPKAVTEGVERVRRYVRDADAPANTSVLLEMAGEAVLRLGRYAEAVDLFSQAYQIGLLDAGKTDLFLWRLGQLAEEVGDWERAVFAYQEIIRATGSGRGYEARLRLSELARRFPGMQIEVIELDDLK
jgi:tetratricopeptide (TPR) repeat protein